MDNISALKQFTSL